MIADLPLYYPQVFKDENNDLVKVWRITTSDNTDQEKRMTRAQHRMTVTYSIVKQEEEDPELQYFHLSTDSEDTLWNIFANCLSLKVAEPDV